jgi:hypothetical protein
VEKNTSRELEELLKLDPEELLRVLQEEALNSPLWQIPPPDHPIFQEGWVIFTLPRSGRSKSDPHENPPSGSEGEK